MLEEKPESIFMPIFRHLVQATGVTLVNVGFLNTDEVQSISGAVISLVAVAWGICKRRKVAVCQN